MGEYLFAVTTKKMTKTQATKRDKIAREVGGNGCGYVHFYDGARHEYRGWGYAPNRGQPFDTYTSSAIYAAWAKAGV